MDGNNKDDMAEDDAGAAVDDNPYSDGNLKLVSIREARFGAAAYAAAGFILFYIYLSFIVLNMNYTYDYTQMRLSPSPGPFHSSRYGYPWAMSYMLCFNVLGPITMMAAVGEIEYRSRLRIHWAFNFLLTLANVVAFFSFLGIWIGYCNTSYSFGSPCMDPRNCCVNFAGGDGPTWCPTASGCTVPYSWSNLSRWDPFFLSFLWSAFFFIYCFFGYTLNSNLAKTIRNNKDIRFYLSHHHQN